MTENPVGSDGLLARSSGIWAKDKLYYLEQYLGIFSVGMQKKWHGKLYYVDLFAGPGRCYIRETGEEVDGSPLIALKFNFANYFFFEADQACCRALQRRVESRAPNKSVMIIPGDCNKKISEVKPPPGSLGVAFIDPTGVSPLAFETIRQLAHNRKIDLIINFHEGMGVRMNIHQYAHRENTALDVFMGSNRWRRQFQQGSMSFDQACRAIASEYLENLEGEDYLAFDSDRIPVRTEREALLYYLIFASKNKKGNEFWRKIVLIDLHGQRSFPYDAHQR